VSYSTDASLTTTYTYDSTSATGTHPIGRLSSITKGSTAIGYTYDLFGRMLQDGALSYAYDLNGNRSSIAYPGNVTACYSFDAADRQAALAYSTAGGAGACSGTTTPIVTSTPSAPTIYLAAGPLQTLHLANGLIETHLFDQRTYPTAISAGTLLAWTYTTDAVGNITAIAPGRTFGYQDYQYFLTQADAPSLWGTRTWVYDTIGNRLSENRGSGVQDTYNYVPNTASPVGDTPILKTITLASGAGTKYLTTDPAGNVILEAQPTSHLDLVADAAGKLARMTEETERTTGTLTYDGRGFLWSARNAVTDCGPIVTSATYGSEGLLYYRQQQNLFSGTLQAQTRVFYFAGRPVAQLDGAPASGVLTYLSVDHLGTPNLASNGAGLATWSGGFEPFGRDYTSPSAMNAGIFLRLPGQWDDAVWDGQRLTSNMYYNLNRWYEPATARYSQPDPMDGVAQAYANRLMVRPGNYFAYAQADPLMFADPLGLFPSPGCVLQWTAIGAAGGAIGGAVLGGAGGAVVCTPFAPGVGTIGCGVGGAGGGAVVGGITGGLLGALYGALRCPDESCKDKKYELCEAARAVDEGVCRYFAARKDWRRYRACNSQAAVRYSECLRFGRPLSPLFPSPFED
jgi:RHS repeat-associated protein